VVVVNVVHCIAKSIRKERERERKRKRPKFLKAVYRTKDL